VAVKCRAAYAHLRFFYPLRYILLSKTAHFSIITRYFLLLLRYLITSMSSTFWLLINNSLTVYCVFKILASISSIAFVSTTVYLRITRDLAGLECGNTLFSTCTVSFFFLAFLYLFQLNSELYFTFNFFVIRNQDYLTFPIHCSTKFRAAFSYASV